MNPVVFGLVAAFCIAAGPATQPARPIDRLLAELRSSEGRPGIKVAADADGRVFGIMLSSRWVTPENVRLMAELPELTRLETHCPGPGDVDAQMVDDIAKLKSLKRLTFYYSRNPWTGATMDKLQPLRRLEDLSFVYIQIDTDAVAELGKLSSVRRLTLAATQTVDDSSVLALRPLLPQLESLDLRDTKVTDASLHILAEARHLTRLNLLRTSVTAAGIADAHFSPQTRVIRGD